MRLEVIETQTDPSHRHYIVLVEDPEKHIVVRWLNRIVDEIVGPLVFNYRFGPEITEERSFDSVDVLWVGRARLTVAI